MPAHKVAYIREQNNNTMASRLFLEEPIDESPVPNPVETFEQCFADYPDLLRKYSAFNKTILCFNELYF